MLSVTFNRSGDVTVFAMADGVSVNVTAPINRLQELLPAATFAAVRDRMAEFLDITSQAARIGGRS